MDDFEEYWSDIDADILINADAPCTAGKLRENKRASEREREREREPLSE